MRKNHHGPAAQAAHAGGAHHRRRVGAVEYLAEEPYVSTDDAFVRAAKVAVNARVAGQAIEIAVHNNEHVRKGQILFQIDPQAYEIVVEQAEARLATARVQINSLKATYRQQQAELQSAKDSAAFDERDYDRKKQLVASDFTSRAVYERAETDLRVAEWSVRANTALLNSLGPASPH